MGKKEAWKNYDINPSIYKKYLLRLREESRNRGIKLRDLELEYFNVG